MLIPSIDLMGGRIVQLVHGETLKLAFDDFEYWIERFSGYPLVQLIDLDAAMRQGENRALIAKFAARLPCQVGGGIATAAAARQLIEEGARRVIVGSALFHSGAVLAGEAVQHAGLQSKPQAASGKNVGARPDSLVNTNFAASLAEHVGADRIVCSVDTKKGRVSIKGWKEEVALTPDEAMILLEPFCAAFLYTHIDREGTMQGFPMEVAERLRQVTARQLIVAGGIKQRAEIDALHAIRVDAVAGMAVYTGALAT